MRKTEEQEHVEVLHALAAEKALKASGKSLGEVAGKILQVYARDIEAHQDVDRFGAPSECHDLVWRSTYRMLRAVLFEYGLTPADFNTLINLRCDAKQAYQLGLDVPESLSEGR